MKCKLRIAVVAFFLFFSFSARLLAQTTAGDELNLGVQAYKQSQFEKAIEHFEKCLSLAPENTTAHLYLATALAQEYIPGADTPDNTRMAEQAIEHYQHVLDGDLSTGRVESAKGIAYLYLQLKKFDEAKQYYRMAADLDSSDPENYYSMGVIAWNQTYERRQKARAKLGMETWEALPTKNKKVCAEVWEKNGANIEEAIDNLNTAVRRRPDYDDAMAYMNLMYRERADIQCDDPAAAAADLNTADEWVDKTRATKKVKSKKAGASATPAEPNPQ